MAKLTITFKYFSAFINQTTGTTVFLPTAHHPDATIHGTGIAGSPIRLTGIQVFVRDTGGGAVVSGPAAPAMGGFLTPLTCMLPDAATQFDASLLTAPLQAATFNARFSLPWGRLTDHPMQGADFRDVLWNFGNNCEHRATDLVSYSYDLPAGAAYELVIGDLAIPLVNDAEFSVENGDELADDEECPTAPLEDPFPLDEFPILVSALGLTVPQIPSASLPPHLNLLLEQATSLQLAFAKKTLTASPDLVKAFGTPLPLRICQPCPDCQLNLF